MQVLYLLRITTDYKIEFALAVTVLVEVMLKIVYRDARFWMLSRDLGIFLRFMGYFYFWQKSLWKNLRAIQEADRFIVRDFSLTSRSVQYFSKS